MDVTTSPPPTQPSTLILSSSVSTSVRFFSGPKYGLDPFADTDEEEENASAEAKEKIFSGPKYGLHPFDDIDEKEEVENTSAEAKEKKPLASFTSTRSYDDAFPEVDSTQDGENSTQESDDSPSLCEFYVTAQTSLSSSQASLEVEETNSTTDNHNSSTSTSSFYVTGGPSSSMMTHSAFKRSLTFFESLIGGGNPNLDRLLKSSSLLDVASLASSARSASPYSSLSSASSSSMARPITIADIAGHIHRKTLKRGFELTLAVLGEQGLGKSTLVNSLFRADIFPNGHQPRTQLQKIANGSLETTSVHLKEHHVDLHLTVIEVTPALGGQNCSQSLGELIEGRFSGHLEAVTRLNRPQTLVDDRLHACLYLVPPSGLKAGDLECMLQLHDKVNVIPVIGKADTLTPEELEALKKKTMDAIAAHQIKLYDFPEWARVEADFAAASVAEEEEEEATVGDRRSEETEKEKEEKNADEKCKEEAEEKGVVEGDGQASPSQQQKQPLPRILAVVGSNSKQEIDGRLVRVRQYPWGVIEVENPLHCDLSTLRRQLMHHLLDLREVTSAVFYENYRSREIRLQEQLNQRQTALLELEAHFLDELKRIEEEHADLLYQQELGEIRRLEQESDEILALERQIARLKVKRMRLEAGEEELELELKEQEEEVEVDWQSTIGSPVNYGALIDRLNACDAVPSSNQHGSGKKAISGQQQTIPKERIALPKMKSAFSAFKSDIKRVASLKSMRHYFASSSSSPNSSSTSSKGRKRSSEA